MTEQKNIYQRMHEAMREVKYVQKDTRIQGYMGVSHDAVVASVRSALLGAGIYVKISTRRISDAPIVGKDGKPTNGTRVTVGVIVTMVNVDNPADRITSMFSAAGDDYGDKAHGKAYSYAVKTALLKMLMLETGENDESRFSDSAGEAWAAPITAAEYKRLAAKIAATGSDEAAFTEYLSSRSTDNGGPAFSTLDLMPSGLIPVAEAALAAKEKKANNND
jgi:hypothetical protein